MANEARKRVLVLSGGGGRGAYQIGALETLLGAAWTPEVIVGTSIGSLNACALVSGYDPARRPGDWMRERLAFMREHWQGMASQDVQEVEPAIPAPVALALHQLLAPVLFSDATPAPPPEGGLLSPDEDGGMLPALAQRLFSAFDQYGLPVPNLLTTSPWRRTLASWIDEERLNAPGAPAVLATATDIKRGTLRVFANSGGERLGLNEVIASSSIPCLYPPTEVDGRFYWDGCALSNTPLDQALDALAGAPADIISVLLTPFYQEGDEERQLPQTMLEAVTPMVDYFLHAPFQVALKRLVPGQQHTIVAPSVANASWFNLKRVLDYAPATHETLFDLGRDDTARALRLSLD